MRFARRILSSATHKSAVRSHKTRVCGLMLRPLAITSSVYSARDWNEMRRHMREREREREIRIYNMYIYFAT